MPIMQAFRSRAKTLVAKAIIALLVVAMAAFGLEAFFYNQNANGVANVVTVNGQGISESAIENATFTYRQQLTSQFGEQYVDQLAESTISEGAISRLTRETLLEQKSQSYGFITSDDRVEFEIASAEQFRDEQGFNRERFVDFLQANSMTAQQLGDNVRHSIVLQTLPNFISQSAFTTDAEKKLFAGIVYESRDLAYVQLVNEDFTQGIEPTEQQIQNYYDDNSGLFFTEEAASFEYIKIDKTTLASEVGQPDEEAISLAYQNHIAELSQDNRYAISHILITTEDRSDEEALERATEVEKLIASGREFNDLVKEYSEDLGSVADDGSLGKIQLDDFLPEFVDQAKLMTVGEISAPIASSFGYHIIRLDETPESSLPSLDEIHDQLVDEIRQNEISTGFDALKTELSDSTYSALDLQTPASELGLELLSKDFITRSGSEDDDDLFANQLVLDEAFGDEVLEDGLNSQLIDLGDRALVLRLKELREGRQLSLEEVIDDVRQSVIQQQAQDQVTELAANLVEMFNKEIGEDKKIDDLISDDDFIDQFTAQLPEGIELNWTVERGITRFSQVDRQIITLAFDLGYGRNLQKIDRFSSTYLAALIGSSKPTYESLDDQQKQDVDQQLDQSNASEASLALYEQLEKQASIIDRREDNSF